MSARLWLLACLALAPSLRAQETPDDPLEKRISLSFTGTLEEQVELLRQRTGLRIKVDAADVPEADAKVELVLRDVKASNALHWIAELHGCGTIRRDGVLLVSPEVRGYRGDTVLKTYDIDGLSFTSRIVVPPRLGLGKEVQPGLQILKEEPKPPTGETDTVADTFSSGEVLVDLLKGTVAPGTWEGRCTADLDPMKKLVVNQTPEVHREVEWFLGALKSFPKTSISLSLEIVEADATLDDLLEPASPAILPREAAEKVARRLHAAGARSLQVSGRIGDRFHTMLTEETGGVTGFMKGNPMVGRWLREADLLEVVPSVLDRGQALYLELRLSLGHTFSRETVKTRPGLLPLQERQLAELGTSVILPAGGGVVLSLPSRRADAPRPRLALLRAAPSEEPARPIPSHVMSALPGPPEDPLLQKLKAVPATALDLKDAPMGEFAAWLRTAGINVVVAPDFAGEKVSLRIQGVPLSTILTLTLGAHEGTYFVDHEAVFLRKRVERPEPLRTCILSIRDVLPGIPEFPARPVAEGEETWTSEDLANLIKNTVHKEQWEEADGKTIWCQEGLLLLTNHDWVLKDVLAFVEERRKAVPSTVSILAETVLLPVAQADEILGAGGEGPALVDADRKSQLRKAGTLLERLAWTSLDRQRSSLHWDRSRDHLHTVDGDDPILRADLSPSFLDVLPTVERERKTVRVELSYQDRRLLELETVKLADDVSIQVPSGQTVKAACTVTIPADRSAVFRWSAPSKAGEPARCRLLLLSVTP